MRHSLSFRFFLSVIHLNIKSSNTKLIQYTSESANIINKNIVTETAKHAR